MFWPFAKRTEVFDEYLIQVTFPLRGKLEHKGRSENRQRRLKPTKCDGSGDRVPDEGYHNHATMTMRTWRAESESTTRQTTCESERPSKR